MNQTSHNSPLNEEKREAALASYAADAGNSPGRRYSEPPHVYRGEYQRDRDRIIHSKAFRRLEYKTQVFVNHEGDLFRTRLTHSLEVAQLSRTIARHLHLNEDLAEAIALAHDFGHTPFGHAGEEALNDCMRDYGGFEHNLQSLRVVDELEQRYLAFNGLNLMYETREGILKRCSPEKAKELGDLGKRFLEGKQPSLESQVVNLADGIAYNSHDVDDGLRANLLTAQDLSNQKLFAQCYEEARRYGVNLQQKNTSPRLLIHETIRRLIDIQVSDLLEASRRRLKSVTTLETARAAAKPLIVFSSAMQEQHQQLKQFLRLNLYQHYRVHRMSMKAKNIVQSLFITFYRDINLLPLDTRARLEQLQEKMSQDAAKAQLVVDYIAGMTDRYAISEYQRLFDPITLP